MRTRHIYMALLLLLFAVPAYAQFTTNYWPSWEHTRFYRQQRIQCDSSVVERCKAAGVTPTPQTVGYHSARTMVTWWKSILKDCLPHYVMTNATIGDNGMYSNWFGSAAAPVVFPVFTVTSICAMAYLPTNVFDYTPRHSLHGQGPFTNDTTVGHAYGYTNEYTLNGGPYLPPGRSTWYTTDYGLPAITNIIGWLVWTYETPLDISGGILRRRFSASQIAAIANTNGWVAYTNAIAANPGNIVGGGTKQYQSLGRGWIDAGVYYYNNDVQGYQFVKTLIETSIAHTVSEYVVMQGSYDVDGYMPALTGAIVRAEYPESYVSAYTSAVLQGVGYPINVISNIPFTPDLIDADADSDLTLQMQTVAEYYLLKWDGTNGFKYK